MVNAKQMSELLNDALKIDPTSIKRLMSVHSPCSAQLAEHEHINVSSADGKNGPFYITFIGIMNGMLSHSGSDDLLSVQVDENNKIIKFTTTTRQEVGLK